MTGLYSAEPYYKDIDTLEELDESGYPIGTTSGSLGNIFKEDFGSPLIKSLESKYTISNITSIATIERTAYTRDICCVERQTDIKVIIAVGVLNTNAKFQNNLPIYFIEIESLCKFE